MRRPPLGGTGCVAGLDSTTDAMFWHSENSRAESQFLVAQRCLQFTRMMLADALTRSVGPAVPQGSRPARAHSVDPQLASGSANRGEGSPRGVAPGRADAAVASGSHDKGEGRAEPPAEEDSCDKGKVTPTL